MRGQLSFYGLFFNAPASTDATRQERPRNYFMPERNNVLAHRWYFYAWIRDFSASRCMEELEREFFLTTARLEVILASIQPILREINTTKPTVKQMEKQFPWLNWKLSAEEEARYQKKLEDWKG